MATCKPRARGGFIQSPPTRLSPHLAFQARRAKPSVLRQDNDSLTHGHHPPVSSLRNAGRSKSTGAAASSQDLQCCLFVRPGVSWPVSSVSARFPHTASFASLTRQVYECMVRGIAVMRRRTDSYVNATQILKVAGVDKGRRTKILEKEILPGKHEIVQGGYGKYQGTWYVPSSVHASFDSLHTY